MDEVFAFQSASFPAGHASDPNTEESCASGLACLQYIVDAIRSETMCVRVAPIAEGSGCTAILRVHGASVALHLTWFPAGPPGSRSQDVWTLQIWPQEGWLRGALRKALGRDAPDVDEVERAVEDVLRGRSDEFSDVRICTWRDLER